MKINHRITKLICAVAIMATASSANSQSNAEAKKTYLRVDAGYSYVPKKINSNYGKKPKGAFLGAVGAGYIINSKFIDSPKTQLTSEDEKELEEGLDEEEDFEDSENFIEWEKVTYAKLSINVGYNVIDNASVWLGANRSRLYNSLAVTKEVLNSADESMFTEKSNYVEWNGYSAGIRYSFN